MVIKWLAFVYHARQFPHIYGTKNVDGTPLLNFFSFTLKKEFVKFYCTGPLLVGLNEGKEELASVIFSKKLPDSSSSKDPID